MNIQGVLQAAAWRARAAWSVNDHHQLLWQMVANSLDLDIRGARPRTPYERSGTRNQGRCHRGAADGVVSGVAAGPENERGTAEEGVGGAARR